MTELVPIHIDFDIYKLIESERRAFDEPQYVALRRLLRLPEQLEGDRPETEKLTQEGRSWREGVVEIPHGTLARLEYDRGRQVYEGKFLDGLIVVGSRSFESLSEAARALAVTKKGKSPSLNGWKYWSAKLPGEQNWRTLWDLRQEAHAKITSKIKIHS